MTGIKIMVVLFIVLPLYLMLMQPSAKLPESYDVYIPPRFKLLEEFKPFELPNQHSNGRLVQDTITTDCYMVIGIGGTSGGFTMIKTECPEHEIH